MKLISKLTLFITLSKLAIVLLFVLTIPFLIGEIARQYTDAYLQQQKEKVLDAISRTGVETYLQGEDSYGSYTMLKEEYISLEPVAPDFRIDTIYTDRRIIEQDTIQYRVLMHAFRSDDGDFIMEVGKAVSTIDQYNRPLQRVATYVLLGLILITIVIDLFYTRYLLHPLDKIIQSKIRSRSFPFNNHSEPVKTTTTDFKYLDNSLILLMQQIHEAFEKEREFTANASHELMTPIGILQNKIENLMGEEDLGDMVQEKLIGMQRTLNRLKKIVSSLLLISRIDNSQFSREDTVRVEDLIDEIVEEIGHRLSEREINLQKKLLSKIELKSVNRDLLFQMIYNLLNNAIKYNKLHGSIQISDEFTPDHNYVLRITDSGVGIPEEELSTIFNRFKKAGSSDVPGYGLGLSIVKSIADYHQIELNVKSTFGVGTEFVLQFPQNLWVRHS